MFLKKLTLPLAALALFSFLSTTPILAPEASASHSDRSEHRNGTYFQRHPYVKKAAIGAGIGAGAGLLFSHGTKGVVKGAAIGAGAGLGYEYLRRKHKI